MQKNPEFLCIHHLMTSDIQDQLPIIASLTMHFCNLTSHHFVSVWTNPCIILMSHMCSNGIFAEWDWVKPHKMVQVLGTNKHSNESYKNMKKERSRTYTCGIY